MPDWHWTMLVFVLPLKMQSETASFCNLTEPSSRFLYRKPAVIPDIHPDHSISVFIRILP